MFSNDSYREWEKFGKEDPYFGVITQEKFRKHNLTDENKEDFFKSGLSYIDDIFRKIRQRVDQTFTIKKALDFGCGVGRLVIPLSNVAQEVTGIDVSDSMLNEAKKNCEAQSIHNVVFAKSDDSLSALNGKYDFIHSFIVFQHIPVKRGERIFENLISRLESGGILRFAFQICHELKIQEICSICKEIFTMFRKFHQFDKGKKAFRSSNADEFLRP